MLTLTFQFGPERRGITHERIVEVVALVDLRPVGNAPRGIAGTFNYHGEWIPVVDLSLIATERPAPRRWSTRVLIIDSPFRDRSRRPLGLIAEGATEMISTRDHDPTDTPVPELPLPDIFSEALQEWVICFTEPPPASPEPPATRSRRRPRHYQPGA